MGNLFFKLSSVLLSFLFFAPAWAEALPEAPLSAVHADFDDEAKHECPILSVERTTNRNRLWYFAVFKNGVLDPAHPVVARWEMIEKGPGVWESMTWLEENRAYGVKLKDHSRAHAVFSVRAMPGQFFQMESDGATCPLLTTDSKGARLKVRQVYLELDESGLWPKLKEIHFGADFKVK